MRHMRSDERYGSDGLCVIGLEGVAGELCDAGLSVTAGTALPRKATGFPSRSSMLLCLY